MRSNFSSASFPESLLEFASHSRQRRALERVEAMQDVSPSGALKGGRGRQGPSQGFQSGHWIISASLPAEGIRVGGAGSYPVNHGPEVLFEGEPERCLFKTARKSVPGSII